MNAKEVIKTIISLRGYSQRTLAQKMGYKTQSCVGSLLRKQNTSMRVQSMVAMLDAMDCELIVRDPYGKHEWKITLDDDTVYCYGIGNDKPEICPYANECKSFADISKSTDTSKTYICKGGNCLRDGDE